MQNRSLFFIFTSIILFFTVFYTGVVHAAPFLPDVTKIPDVATMLKNFAAQQDNFMRLVTAFAYVMGIFFSVKGLFALKQYSETRTMMSAQHSLKGPLIYLAVGAALIYLPTAIRAGVTTFWTKPNIYAYVTEFEDPWGGAVKAIFMVIQLIGVIAFIRGLILFTHLGGQGGHQPGTFGRALTHIIGGVFCINMYEFIQAVFNTLGLK